MSVFLLSKLHHMGCPAALGGTSIQTSREWYDNISGFKYRGKRMIRVTMCNIQIQLNGDILTAYLSKYGSVEAVTL